MSYFQLPKMVHSYYCGRVVPHLGIGSATVTIGYCIGKVAIVVLVHSLLLLQRRPGARLPAHYI